MTREEAIDILKWDINYGDGKIKDAINMAIKALEQKPCEDCISRKAVLDMQYRIDDSSTLSTRDVVNVDDVEDLPSVTPQQPRWIPLNERPSTDEERKEYGAEIGFVYDCELPEDSQDVLVTTPYGVRQTTFYTDYGCYFENYEDEGDVIAWMPLPEPYKADNKNKQGLAYADQDTLMSAT